MKNLRITRVFLGIFLLACLHGVAFGEEKHLLQYYGPFTNAQNFMKDLALYSQSFPFFHGRTMEPAGTIHVFGKPSLSDGDFTQDDNLLKNWKTQTLTLTRNYARVLCHAKTGWNMSLVADRNATVESFRVLARHIRKQGLLGLLLDTEPYSYGYNPWRFNDSLAPWSGSRSFAQCQQDMQDLGAAVIAAIEAEAPGTRILFTQGLSALRSLCSVNGIPVPSVDPTALQNHKYSLLPSFIAGLASGLSTCSLVDLQEAAGYWATSESDFVQSNNYTANLSPNLLLPAGAVAAYRNKIQLGHMLYTDALLRYSSDRRYLSGWMLKEERPKFARAMTFWALRNTSGGASGHGEVMLFTESNLWGTPWGGGATTLPPTEFRDALTLAIEDVPRGSTPDVSQIITDARKRKVSGDWPVDLDTTPTPTTMPTTTPTETPTGQPSGIPSGTPSVTPSGSPTGQPSGEPTGSPTNIPTTSPSGIISVAPSGGGGGGGGCSTGALLPATLLLLAPAAFLLRR